MKNFILITAIVAILFVASSSNFVAAADSASSTCHNATGTCTKQHFVCANEELIPHSKRCDGVEDCADGTDEYMCDQSSKPLHERSFAERAAITEVACVQCTCKKGSISVTNTQGSWWTTALNAPRDMKMMTDAPLRGNKPCNPAGTTEIILNVYKKQNKGCRGWVCCFRQEECKTCTVGSTATHCYL